MTVQDLHGLPLFLLKIVVLVTSPFVRVSGVEVLRRLDRPVIFALNHNIYAETLVIPCHLMFQSGRKTSFLIHWMFKDFPFLGWLMRFIDPVWVWTRPTGKLRRHSRKLIGRKSAADEAVQRLRSGVSVGIFPEGTRNKYPFALLPGRRGVGEIALRCEAMVVPVGIVFPHNKRRQRFRAWGRMIMRVGTPLDCSAARRETPSAIRTHNFLNHDERKTLREPARSVTTKVMRDLSRLSGKALPE